MRKVQHIKLNTEVTDNASGLRGTLTHLLIEMDGSAQYAFQPRGLNPETGRPLKSFWVSSPRLHLALGYYDVTDLPVEVLGTIVEDKASGFTGMAVSLILHTNGCVHFTVKPAGALTKTGESIEAVEFDIRRLCGVAITQMTETELKADQVRKPSPLGAPDRRVV